MVTTERDLDRLRMTNLKKFAKFFKMRYLWRSSFKDGVKWVLATGLGDLILLRFFHHATEKQSINELRL